MVFVVVQSEDGRNTSGTGFNVSPSGLIVTNRHVVRDEQGRPAKLVVVKFDNAPADAKFKLVRVVKVSETDELAWLKLDGGGPYPTVQGVARAPSTRPGAPVALLGYPLGTGTAGMDGDINRLRPVSSLTVGTVSKVLGDTLQLDVYAAQGSSGSPVFNAQGVVVGVLFGSPTASSGRIIYAVPSSKLAAQMPPEGAAVIR
jgi:S1-C subfamily serine protease